MKEHFQSLIGADEDSQAPSQFKARTLNKKILTGVDRLPDVPNKEKTTFQEFNLSKPKFDKGDKENATELEREERLFKARPFDKKIMEDPFRPSTIISNKKTESVPFNFATNERVGRSSTVKRADKEDQVQFKAREMPKYTFFEPNRSSHRPSTTF